MKKYLRITSFVLAISASLVMLGCKKKPSDETTNAPETPVITEDTVKTDAITTAPADNTTDTTENTTAGNTDGGVIYFDTEAYGDGWEIADMSSQILATNENWSLTGNGNHGGFVYRDGYCGSDYHDNSFDLVNMYYIGEEENYKFDFDVWTKENTDPLDEPAWMTLFIGLRLQSLNARASEPASGIWLTVKDGTLGVQSGVWPDGITLINLPRGFTDGFRRVYVADDQINNIIRVYIGTDDGRKMLVSEIEIDSNNEDNTTYLNVYSVTESGRELVGKLDKGAELFRGGYVKLWSHNRAGVYIKNVAFKVN